MCIAVYQPPNTEKLPYDAFRAFREHNPDGNGVAFFEDGDPVIHKDLWDLEGVYDTYEFAVENNYPVFVHLRIRTVGEITEDNCQPLKVYDDLLMMHNGTITLSGFDAEGAGKSDSVEFKDRILKNIPRDQFSNEAICELLEDYVGMSRVAFLAPNGESLILNEDYGCWADGIWYSNLLFIADAYRHRVASNRMPVSNAVDYTYSGYPYNSRKGDKESDIANAEIAILNEDESESDCEYDWDSEGEFCIYGLRYCGEIMCWGCAPGNLTGEYMLPILQENAPHYCLLCGKCLDNNNTSRVAEDNSGEFEHSQRPSSRKRAG